jgi:uncharacterized protein YbbC (DUF1343 family)
MNSRFLRFYYTALLLTGVAQSVFSQARFGSEVFFDEHIHRFKDVRTALVVNPVSMVGGRFLADTLIAAGIPVTLFFAAEHGIRGAAAAGELIADGIDKPTGLPVISLYGKKKVPDSLDMAGIDAVLFDLQDVGARPFTYASTMANVMEACARWGKRFIVLDRPNPLGGTSVSGWVLEDSLRSFVGKFPVPMVHGLTLGEMALMIKGEQWVAGLKTLQLEIIPVKGWKRSETWLETGRPWIAPSPNLRSLDAVFLYPGTVLVEGTTLSEGRGTPRPFEFIGAPELACNLKELNTRLISFGYIALPDTATPKTIAGKATRPKWEGQFCRGVFLKRTLPPEETDAFSTGIVLLQHLLGYNKSQNTNSFLRKLAGSGQIETAVKDTAEPEKYWKAEVSAYIASRKKYLLYE